MPKLVWKIYNSHVLSVGYFPNKNFIKKWTMSSCPLIWAHCMGDAGKYCNKFCYFFYRPSNVLRINIILMWRSPVTVSIGIFRCIFYTISTPSMLTRALKQTGCNIYFKTINVTWFSLLRLVYDTKLLSGDDYERPSLNQLKQYILYCCTI